MLGTFSFSYIVAFLLLGTYGKVIWLIVSSVILGIGHVGIHWQHFRTVKRQHPHP